MVALLYIIYFWLDLRIFIHKVALGFRMVIVLLRLYPHVVIWYERFNSLYFTSHCYFIHESAML